MDSTTDTTTFGIMTGADALTGGLLSGIADVGALAQATGTAAVQVNTAVARANAPVVATPVAVNTVTGQMATTNPASMLSGLGAIGSNPMVLILILVVIVAVASK